MPRHGESIWKRKDGRWEARYIASRDSNGKAHYSSVYAGSYQKVKKKRADAIAVMRQSITVESKKDSSTSFTVVANEYLHTRQSALKESTLSHYSELLTWYAYPQLGEKPISAITQEDIDLLSDNLLNHGGKADDGLAPKTIKDTMVLIKQVMSYAEKRYLKCHSEIVYPYPKQRGCQVVILTPADQKSLEAYIFSHQSPVTVGILLALYTGIRIGELCGLMWSDINLVDGILSVSKTLLRIENTDPANQPKIAVKAGTLIDDNALDEAYETVRHGARKDWGIDYLERVARHESGHALMNYLGGNTPAYLTIVARGDHGGYMEHSAEELGPMQTKSELLHRIRTALGGRAAEIVYYGLEDGLSSGASGDLRQASRIAEAIVCEYGMVEQTGLYISHHKEGMEKERTDVINQILNEEMKKAVEMISINRDRVDRLVAQLLRKNKLTADEIINCLKETSVR